MTDLLIRNIDPHMRQALAERARSDRHSMSEEAKMLLKKALLEPPDQRKMGTAMAELLPEEARSDDYVFEVPGEVSRPPDFE